MKLLQTLTSLKYCNKKIRKKNLAPLIKMMEGVGIIKLKTFYTIFFSAFSLMYVNS
jgi:hypothetical protein